MVLALEEQKRPLGALEISQRNTVFGEAMCRRIEQMCIRDSTERLQHGDRMIVRREKHQCDGGCEVGIGCVIKPFDEVAEKRRDGHFLDHLLLFGLFRHGSPVGGCDCCAGTHHVTCFLLLNLSVRSRVLRTQRTL